MPFPRTLILCEMSHPGFEFKSPTPFSMILTIKLSALRVERDF